MNRHGMESQYYRFIVSDGEKLHPSSAMSVTHKFLRSLPQM